VTRLLIPLVPRDAARSPVAPDLEVTGGTLHGWSHAVSTSADAALVLDPRGAVVAASAGASRLLGQPVADLLGRELPRAAGFVDFHAVPRSLDGDGATLVPMQALRSDSPARGLIRVRLVDGTLITCDAVAAPVHDTTGRLAGAVVLLSRVGI
jgi:PAS domain-containing protein